MAAVTKARAAKEGNSSSSGSKNTSYPIYIASSQAASSSSSSPRAGVYALQFPFLPSLTITKSTTPHYGILHSPASTSTSSSSSSAPAPQHLLEFPPRGTAPASASAHVAHIYSVQPSSSASTDGTPAAAAAAAAPPPDGYSDVLLVWSEARQAYILEPVRSTLLLRLEKQRRAAGARAKELLSRLPHSMRDDGLIEAEEQEQGAAKGGKRRRLSRIGAKEEGRDIASRRSMGESLSSKDVAEDTLSLPLPGLGGDRDRSKAKTPTMQSTQRRALSPTMQVQPPSSNTREPRTLASPVGLGLTVTHTANDGDEDDDDEDEENGESAAFFAASSAPQTPNITEAAQHLRRSLSIHGLHELSNMPPKEIRRSVGNKVWRPHDEIAKLPGDWERLAVHVFRGGVRAWNLAYGLRATIMLVLALIKGLRSRKLKAKDLRSAVFSIPNFRFALMFALWASIYKTVHNSLRLITPVPRRPPRKSRSVDALDSVTPSTPPRPVAEAVPINTDPRPHSSDYGSGDESTLTSANRSGAATPRSGYEELKGKSEEDKSKIKSKQKKRAFMSDPRSKVWHAYVAGAVSAVAVMVETKDSRVSLAQQLLVRGLEGTYNVAHEKKYINIPHGAVLAFGMACGQIMWAWLNAPDTLPRGYINWITNASMIAPSSLSVHRAVAHNAPLDVDAALKGYFPNGKLPDPRKTSSGALRYPPVGRTKVNRRGIAASNVALIAEWAEKARKGDLGLTVPCAVVHPWESSHFWSPFDRFFEVVRWILPVYMTLYFVPAVFLRTGSFLKNPLRVFLRSAFGSLRSSSFLGAFVIIFQTLFCAAHSLHDRILLSPYLTSITPTWLLAFLRGTSVHWLAGFATSASLFVDHARRRAELAAYVLPKGMESAWSVARKRGWAPFVPGGDLLLTSVGMSLVMGTYARSPDHLSGLVRRIVYQFIGRN